MFSLSVSVRLIGIEMTQIRYAFKKNPLSYLAMMQEDKVLAYDFQRKSHCEKFDLFIIFLFLTINKRKYGERIVIFSYARAAKKMPSIKKKR